MTVKDIASIIEKHAPLSTAMSYDNCGLQLGDYDAVVDKILISVDLTIEAIEKAAGLGANLIVTHHPVLFNPIKNIILKDYVSDLIMQAIKNGINVYAAHTNADIAEEGLNNTLINIIGGQNIVPLTSYGIGSVAEFSQSFNDLYDNVKEKVKGVLRTDTDRKDGKNIINRIALITGSGGRDAELPKILQENNIDCFITAEVAHHVRRELIDRKINLIEFGHYESERIFIEIASEWLENAGLEVIKAYDSAFNN